MNKIKKIEVRVTENEKNEIRKKAIKAGLDISEYIRKVALEKKLAKRFSDEEMEAYKHLADISMSLKNLGNILNKENREELVNEIRRINEKIKSEVLKFHK